MGYRKSEIAEKAGKNKNLYISRVTVQRTLTHCMGKMGVVPRYPTVFLSRVLAQRPGRQGRAGASMPGLRVPGPRPTPDSQLYYLDPVSNLSKLSFLICMMGMIIICKMGIQVTHLLRFSCV